MESWNPKDCSPRFWWNNATGDAGKWQQVCAKSQSESIYDTFADVLQNGGDYFVAQLPYGYNTGVGRNHVPRFNTSVQYDMVSVDDVPEGCFSDEENAGFIKYSYDSFEETYPGYNRSFHVRTCISNDALRSPLIRTRNRQDFDEAFYLNISISGWRYSTTADQTIFKVSARTTVGYFELPNYYNNARHGPILDEFEITDSRLLNDYASSRTSQHDEDGAELPTALEQVVNKGPLASMYVALFGNGSFLHASASPEYLSYLNSTVGDQEFQCADFVPLGRIYGTVPGSSYGSARAITCIRPSMYPSALRSWAADWLASFLDVERTRAALQISAFLANEITLANPDGRGGMYLQVEPGVEVLAPVMSLSGLIVGSVLLGCFLLVLLGLVVFALSSPHWTDRLDATATMRMGAAMALSTDGLARLAGGEKVLDKAPGFVGDAMQDNDVGRLAVGAEGLLKRPGRYENALCGVMPE
ncbi:hypothetical protein MPH_00177 [Macrophomina phaseolina MS6]|uniref:Uncharacterized protein n=1 Tax=Macrophomina phaseolina (strain MS6) TaxID=1126212 RepID=K2S6A2_MACPH|nr:hypothetical protein MPH_00177 [Macrophomina phaseolina MS6]